MQLEKTYATPAKVPQDQRFMPSRVPRFKF